MQGVMQYYKIVFYTQEYKQDEAQLDSNKFLPAKTDSGNVGKQREEKEQRGDGRIEFRNAKVCLREKKRLKS